MAALARLAAELLELGARDLYLPIEPGLLPARLLQPALPVARVLPGLLQVGARLPGGFLSRPLLGRGIHRPGPLRESGAGSGRGAGVSPDGAPAGVNPGRGHAAHVEGAEAGVAQGRGKAPGPDRVARRRVSEGSMQRVLDLPHGGVTDPLTRVAPQLASLPAQGAHHLLGLLRQASQVARGQPGLGVPEGSAEVEEGGHLVAPLAHQLIGEPGSRGRPAQLLDLPGEGPIPRLAGRGGLTIASGRELGHGQPVQLLGDGVERSPGGRHPGLRTSPANSCSP